MSGNTGYSRAAAPIKAAWDRRERVKKALGDGRTICEACGATLDTYVDQCSATTDATCEGVERVCAAGEGREPKP